MAEVVEDDELPDAIYDQVETLSEQGNVMLDASDVDGAIEVWKRALSILPPPESRWEASMWLHASLGEAYRSKGDLDLALNHFQAAYSSLDGRANPFVQISLGAILFDLNRPDDAKEPLLEAYMLEGAELFEEFGGPYLGYLRDAGLVQ